MKRKYIPSPIHILVVSGVRTKHEEKEHVYLYHLLHHLTQHRLNITVTIITTLTSFPPSIQNNKRITIVTCPYSWMLFWSQIAALQKHCDYILVTTALLRESMWLYGIITRAKTIAFAKKQYHAHTSSRSLINKSIHHIRLWYTNWMLGQYSTILPMPKNQKQPLSRVVESLYQSMYTQSLFSKNLSSTAFMFH